MIDDDYHVYSATSTIPYDCDATRRRGPTTHAHTHTHIYKHPSSIMTPVFPAAHGTGRNRSWLQSTTTKNPRGGKASGATGVQGNGKGLFFFTPRILDRTHRKMQPGKGVGGIYKDGGEGAKQANERNQTMMNVGDSCHFFVPSSLPLLLPRDGKYMTSHPSPSSVTAPANGRTACRTRGL